jgi:hypothetical protein
MNALGFGVIMLIDIPIVHELGVTACIGVMLMIITNKLMLPIILSYLSLSRALMARAQQASGKHALWWRLSALAEPRPAMAVFAVSLMLLGIGAYKARDLAVGDIGLRRAGTAGRFALQPGQPEDHQQLFHRSGCDVGVRAGQGHRRRLPGAAK